MGFRWNLGHGLGLYTGLYCDFGLLRPIAREKGSKVLNYADEDILFQPPYIENEYNHYDETPWISLENSKKVSALAADAPDAAYMEERTVDGDTFSDDVYYKNEAPFAKSLHAMQAGVKLRFSFGRLGKRERLPKEPKIKEPKKPKEPKVIKEVPPEIQQTMIELSDALFAFDKFDLNAEAREMLDRVVSWLSDHPELKVEIGGHTDSRGSDAYNQKLSENRAKAVYDYFVSHGIDASRLSYKGYGESRPIATNETDEGRQRNRRVELQLQ